MFQVLGQTLAETSPLKKNVVNHIVCCRLQYSANAPFSQFACCAMVSLHF